MLDRRSADNRPKYLNLLKIHLPVTGVVSFAHRISGVLMFLSIPVIIWCLERSLSSAEGFDSILNYLDIPWVMISIILVIWSLVHHCFAGIRFLLLDFDIGIMKPASRASAWMVVVLELLVMVYVIQVVI